MGIQENNGSLLRVWGMKLKCGLKLKSGDSQNVNFHSKSKKKDKKTLLTFLKKFIWGYK